MSEMVSAANVSALTERVAWKILCALHTHVPEDERPQSWSDLAEGQEARIVDAASRAIQEVAQTYTNMQSELTAAAYQQGREDAAVALEQALRQWKMYAEMHEDVALDTDATPEAEMYRACKVGIRGAP